MTLETPENLRLACIELTRMTAPRPRVGIPTLVQGIGLVYPQTRSWRALQEARAAHREAGLTKRRKEAMRV